jgi:hypothetical protein
MKASKFTEAQIAFALRQAEDSTPIAEVSRQVRTLRPLKNGNLELQEGPSSETLLATDVAHNVSEKAR